MQQYRVHYAVNPTFGWPKHPNWPGGYRHVADVDADDLDGLFRKTQNLDWSGPNGWHDPGAPLRSLSVGDVAVDERGIAWRCENVGWHALGRALAATA